jgi:hypothetical protein
MSERKQINFTIVPDDAGAPPRVYANFCAIANTPFDCTLTFCEVLPLSEQEIREAEGRSEHIVQAPARARVVVPLQTLQALVVALQEHVRGLPSGPVGPVH